MLLRFEATFEGGDAMMGDKVVRPKAGITFSIKGAAMRDIGKVVIFRNNEVVFDREAGAKDFSFKWTDKKPPEEESLWYYARFQAVDEELAWSSPIWFLKK